MKSIGIQFAIILLVSANLIVSSKADAVDDLRAKINIEKDGQEYPLFKLIRDGKTDEVRKMVPKLDDKSDKDNGLVIAALAGRTDIVTFLVESNADVNYKREGTSPLRGGVLFAWACSQSKCPNGENVVAFLVNKLADTNEVLTKENVTILQLASQMENEKVVAHLLRGGADVNSASTKGLTSLHRASYISKNYKIAEVLLQKGARVNVKDIHGWTPIHYATFFGYENTVSILVTYNANAFLTNKDGKTAHNIAEEKNNKKEPHRQRILDMLLLC